jgi:hypothetical protein
MNTATEEHLTDYERAIYYYTLPRVSLAVPVGVIFIYVFFVCMTIVAIAYGLSTDHPQWMQGGGVVLGLLIIGGVMTYLSREFMHELQERLALAKAKTMPDADSQFDEIPDPFADHILLRYPIRHRGSKLPLVNNKGNQVYTAELSDNRKTMSVHDHDEKELFQAVLETSQVSFSFETGSPSRIEVQVSGETVGRVRRKSNFGPAHVTIECLGEVPATYDFQGGGIYFGDELVGRIYEVRQFHYLDIHKKHFRDAILSFFITIG